MPEETKVYYLHFHQQSNSTESQSPAKLKEGYTNRVLTHPDTP